LIYILSTVDLYSTYFVDFITIMFNFKCNKSLKKRRQNVQQFIGRLPND